MSTRILAGPLRPIVHVSAFVRKELVAILRQPVLLLVLVIGPFLLLFLFGLGYDQEQTVLRTQFVGPDGSTYQPAVDRFSEDLGAYIESVGYTTDLVAARDSLAHGDVDLVVVFPPDPSQQVLAGEQAVITVLHDKLDPIQQTAVEVSSQVAVQELNAYVVEQVVTDAQSSLDDEGVTAAIERAGTARPQSDSTDVQAAILDYSALATSIEPRVVVRPFAAETESLTRMPVTVNDFFAPAAVALLLQHMTLTFSALSLVRDRNLGLFELFRVGPVGPLRILVGKYLAHLIVGSGLSAVLLAAVTYGIGVPFRGDVVWAAAGIFGLVTASVTAGMTLSLVARTDTQAVQYAMLALLAGLFFGGFLLDTDAVRYPVKAVSFVLPVTYGTNVLRDVLLRGSQPDPSDLVGLVTLSLAFALLAWWLLARRLRLE